MQTLTTSKVITFNRITRDFDATFDGNYIGSFATFSQAEDALNDHAMRLIEDGLVDAPLALLGAVPDGTPADDFSDVPAGPGEPERAPIPFAGAAIARQWTRDTLRFKKVLTNLDRAIWPILAGPCAEYRGMAAADVLDRWTRLVEGTQVPPSAAERAAQW